MSDAILVETNNPLSLKPEELQGLVEDVRGLRQDAYIAYFDYVPGTYGVTWWEVVTIWVGIKTSEAIIDQIVGCAASWMRERFRRNEDSSIGRRPKVVKIVKYDGETGIESESVELRSPDGAPVRRSPEAFELYTRKKPPIKGDIKGDKS